MATSSHLQVSRRGRGQYSPAPTIQPLRSVVPSTMESDVLSRPMHARLSNEQTPHSSLALLQETAVQNAITNATADVVRNRDVTEREPPDGKDGEYVRVRRGYLRQLEAAQQHIPAGVLSSHHHARGKRSVSPPVSADHDGMKALLTMKESSTDINLASQTLSLSEARHAAIVQAAERNLLEAQRQLVCAQEEIILRRGDLQEANSKLRATTKELHQCKDELIRMQAEAMAAQNALDRDARYVRTTNVELTQLRAQNEGLQAEVQELKKELQRARDQSNKYKGVVDALKLQALKSEHDYSQKPEVVSQKQNSRNVSVTPTPSENKESVDGDKMPLRRSVYESATRERPKNVAGELTTRHVIFHRQNPPPTDVHHDCFQGHSLREVESIPSMPQKYQDERKNYPPGAREYMVSQSQTLDRQEERNELEGNQYIDRDVNSFVDSTLHYDSSPTAMPVPTQPQTRANSGTKPVSQVPLRYDGSLAWSRHNEPYQRSPVAYQAVGDDVEELL